MNGCSFLFVLHFPAAALIPVSHVADGATVPSWTAVANAADDPKPEGLGTPPTPVILGAGRPDNSTEQPTPTETVGHWLEQSPQKEKAVEGENVVFSCLLRPPSRGLEVKWVNQQVEGDLQVLVENQTVEGGGYSGRAFLSGDPQAGDASMTLLNVTSNDYGIYFCNVTLPSGETLRGPGTKLSIRKGLGLFGMEESVGTIIGVVVAAVGVMVGLVTIIVPQFREKLMCPRSCARNRLLPCHVPRNVLGMIWVRERSDSCRLNWLARGLRRVDKPIPTVHAFSKLIRLTRDPTAVNEQDSGQPQRGAVDMRHCSVSVPVWACAGGSRIELGDVTPHNIKQLKRLNQVIFPVSYNDKFYKDVLEVGELAKLAYFNDIAVGAVCCRVDHSQNQKRLYIMTLGCLAPYRRLGIGTKMLNHVLNICEKDGTFDNIYLHVQISNESAIDFYRKFGFEIIETKKNYYKRIEPADAHVLQKNLKTSPAGFDASLVGKRMGGGETRGVGAEAWSRQPGAMYGKTSPSLKGLAATPVVRWPEGLLTGAAPHQELGAAVGCLPAVLLRIYVERHRKKKINAGINRIGELLPCSQALKQSKNMILDQAFKYITQLKQQNDELLLNGGNREQAEEIKRLRRQQEELRRENSHYIELLKANGINFMDDPTIHWKGKLKCTKVAKIPTHQVQEGIIVYSNGNIICPSRQDSPAQNVVFNVGQDLRKPAADAVIVQHSCDLTAAPVPRKCSNRTDLQKKAPAKSAKPTLPQASAASVVAVAAHKVAGKSTLETRKQLPPSVSYITLQRSTVPTSEQSQPVVSVPQELAPQPVVQAPPVKALLTEKSAAVTFESSSSGLCHTVMHTAACLPSLASPANGSDSNGVSTLTRMTSSGNTQTTWTTLQLAGNTVQPLNQMASSVLPPSVNDNSSSSTDSSRQVLNTGSVAATPGLKGVSLCSVRSKQVHSQLAAVTLPSIQPVPVQPLLTQPHIPVQTQPNVLPLLQAMQVIQMTNNASSAVPQAANNPNVVILQPANPCPAPTVVREGLPSQTPCQQIVIIQAANQSSMLQNPQATVVPAAAPAVVPAANQIAASSCSAPMTSVQTVGGKHLVHILPRPLVSTTCKTTGSAQTPQQQQPHTISVNGQIFALQPVKPSTGVSSQSPMQIIQPTTSEDPNTNVALNTFGALASLNQSISQMAGQSSCSEINKDALSMNQKETTPQQQVCALDHDTLGSSLVSSRQTDSPMSTSSGSSRGFSVASMLPNTNREETPCVSSSTNTFSSFSFSEQADIFALAAKAIFDHDNQGKKVATSSVEVPIVWEVSKSQETSTLSKERQGSQQPKLSKHSEGHTEKAQSQVQLSGERPLVSARNSSAGANHHLSIPSSQSSAPAGSLSVNNLIRQNSVSQSYACSSTLNQPTESTPVSAAVHASRSSSASLLSPCSAAGQMLDEHLKDASKRPPQEDLLLSTSKRQKQCHNPNIGRLDMKSALGRTLDSVPDHPQMMVSQLPPSSVTSVSSASNSRGHPEGLSNLFPTSSFMNTVLRQSDIHCAPQAVIQEQQQSQQGGPHLQQHAQHPSAPVGLHLTSGNPYLKQQQEQQQQQLQSQRHHLYQLQHHLTQPEGQPIAQQHHGLHQQRSMQQEAQIQKKRGLVRGGPPVALQQKQHHSGAGDQTLQQKRPHSDKGCENQSASRSHHGGHSQSHLSQEILHQQHQQQQQQQQQQQDSGTGRQQGVQVDHVPGQNPMQRLMTSRTLEQQMASQPSVVSRSSDIICTPSRQERNRISSYSAEALIGKSPSNTEQRMGMAIQASRVSQEQSDMRTYLEASRSKGIVHNIQGRIPTEHPVSTDVQRVSECSPFKTISTNQHQMASFEVQASRNNEMASKTVPSHRSVQSQSFRIGQGASIDRQQRGAYPPPQGIQAGSGIQPRENDSSCHQSFMQSLLAPHLGEQVAGNQRISDHQRAAQCCPPVSMEYNCPPSREGAGEMQGKNASPNVSAQKPNSMRINDSQGNKGHLNPQVNVSMHSSGVRPVLPHPAAPHSSAEPVRSSVRPQSTVSQRSRHPVQDGQSNKIRPAERTRSGNLRPGNPFDPDGHLPLTSSSGMILSRQQAAAERRGSIVRFMADNPQVGGDNPTADQHGLSQNFGFPFIPESGMNPPINANPSFIPPVTQPSATRTPAIIPVEAQNTLPSFYPSYSPAAHPSLPNDISIQYFSNQMFTSPSTEKSNSGGLNNRFGSILSPPRPVGFAQPSFPLLPDMPPMPIANSSGITPHLSNFNLTSLFPEIATALPPDGSAMPMSPLLSLSNAAAAADTGKQPSNRPAHNISHILGHDGSSAV
ncbi:USF3 protein, partial [Atractosteus spatula]|nr:USF3 protein [Atractosteus spatula]